MHLSLAAAVRCHGLSEAEVERVKSDVLADLETAFLEKDQTPSADFAGECVDHYLRQEPLVDLELELEMVRGQLGTMDAGQVAAVAEQYTWDRACLCTVRMPLSRGDAAGDAAPASDDGEQTATENKVTQQQRRRQPCETDILAVFAEVAKLASGGGIAPWKAGGSGQLLRPAQLPAAEPLRAQREWGEGTLGVTEVVLANGMQVVLKKTDFLDDDIQFSVSMLRHRASVVWRVPRPLLS
jgi:zinc protease